MPSTPSRPTRRLTPSGDGAVLEPPLRRSGRASMSVETVRFDATRALIKVAGELDMSTAAPLWAVLQGHLGAGRRFLRLDLSEVTFLDATALTGITTAHRDLLARRGTLIITGVRALVGRVLQMSGLADVLFVSGPRADDDTFDDDTAALATQGDVVGT